MKYDELDSVRKMWMDCIASGMDFADMLEGHLIGGHVQPLIEALKAEDYEAAAEFTVKLNHLTVSLILALIPVLGYKEGHEALESLLDDDDARERVREVAEHLKEMDPEHSEESMEDLSDDEIAQGIQEVIDKVCGKKEDEKESDDE